MKASEVKDGMTVILGNQIIEDVTVISLGAAVKITGFSRTNQKTGVYFVLTDTEVDQWDS